MEPVSIPTVINIFKIKPKPGRQSLIQPIVLKPVGKKYKNTKVIR